MFSRLGIGNADSLSESVCPIDGKFSISDESRQYFGNDYLFFQI
jgi:hypothetical protein